MDRHFCPRSGYNCLFTIALLTIPFCRFILTFGLLVDCIFYPKIDLIEGQMFFFLSSLFFQLLFDNSCQFKVDCTQPIGFLFSMLLCLLVNHDIFDFLLSSWLCLQLIPVEKKNSKFNLKR